jgi:hypothetical protein
MQKSTFCILVYYVIILHMNNPRVSENPGSNMENAAVTFNFKFLTSLPASVLGALKFNRDKVTDANTNQEASDRLSSEIDALEQKITALNASTELTEEIKDQLAEAKFELDSLNAQRDIIDALILKESQD